ncbi:MAG: hypothetical protein GX349_04205 [Firmicutes bacterium]|nr:hypothetical protein [Bacillota bacterium]
MGDDKKRIMRMIEEGKITADEGMELLTALEESSRGEERGAALRKRFLRVRVSSEKGTKANVNIPLSLLKVVSKLLGFATALIPTEARRELQQQGIDLAKIDFEELVHLVEQGLSDGKLVDVETEDEKEGFTKVEVYVE